jgi:hypothetical protein
MPIVKVVPVISHSVRGLCVRPYEGHPRGCPNFDRCPRCPPRVKVFEQVFDIRSPFFAIYSTFDLAKHVAVMRSKHPDWSERQLRCVLYWQGTARKRLRMEIAAFLVGHTSQNWHVETTPEALGCDVTATMKSVGVELPWPPIDLVYHVALAGCAANSMNELGKEAAS